LAKIFLTSFHDDERIVRIIYSENNINPRNKTLKNNFFSFRFNSDTNKNELSCLRFELETIDFCRKFGKTNENPAFNRNYYGLGCTSPKLVKQLPDYVFKFSPSLDTIPPNFFHCDIYDEYSYEPEIGQAKSAQTNFRIDALKARWKVNTDSEFQLTKSEVSTL